MEDIITFLGKKDNEFENKINEKVDYLFKNKRIFKDEAESIDNLELLMLKEGVNISQEELKYIQRLCQTYNNDIRISSITSHRKYVGRFIVLAKKIILKVVSFSLKNYIKQQEEFNANTIKSLISLYNKNVN